MTLTSNIPVNTNAQDKVFALIISNENYKHEQSVPFALNDGEVFAVYCEKTLGLPAKNVRYLSDATLNDINHEIGWLEQIVKAYDGEASVIFYYSGHGMPDENNKDAYLLPIDGYSTDAHSGLSTKSLYTRLGNLPSQRTLVFLDACFSGAKRDGEMMAASRGVAIKVKDEPVKGNNMIVFSAAQGNETAYPYKEQKHGMFTYFILEKLNQTGGSVSMGDLSDYVIQQVRQNSVRENDKSQTPVVTVAGGNKEWRNWKLALQKATSYEKRNPSQKSKVQPKSKADGPLIERTAENSSTSQGTSAESAQLNYTMPSYTIEGAGTGIQGSYLVKVTLMTKKPTTVTDLDFAKCAVHGVLFSGFSGERQHQRPLAGSAANERQHANFYNDFFAHPYSHYALPEPSSRMVAKVAKEYRVSLLVSVKKDQLRKDLTQQGVLRSLTDGF